MATGKAFKQSYFGRVIGPAKYWAGNKPYLTFTLYVDGLLVDEDKNRTSGKIGCSYSIQGDSDPVALILSRIFNKDKPNEGGLAGKPYKTVEVVVEGSERLNVVKDADGNLIPGAVYKNLDYCTVQVTDNNVLQLFKKHQSEGTEDEDDGIQKPTTAPRSKGSFKKKSPPPVTDLETFEEEEGEEEEEEAASEESSYKVGDTIVHSGVTYKFLGGSAADLSNWEKVEKKVKKAKVNPFEAVPQKESKSSTEKSFKDMLDEGEDEDISSLID